MRVLVTGAGGFVGGYLVPRLVSRGHQVYAGELQHSQFKSIKNVNSVKFDITNYQELEYMMSKIRPDGIIHLAAQSMVKRSWENPVLTINVNTIGTINLIKAVKLVVPTCKIINIGTSEEYGLTGKLGQPLGEESPCVPQNPYAISKFAAGQLALQLANKEKLNLIHVRPFNHFGPGQQIGYVVSDFCSQIASIEKGIASPIMYVGDLNAQRDFSDVRDVIEAYIVLLESKADNGVYNICSGKPRTIKNILDLLIQQSSASIEVKIDQERFRPSEVPLFFGSNQKIANAIDWSPKQEFSASLLETLNWWRQQIG